MRREKCNVPVVFRHIAKMYPRDQAALFSSFIFFSLLPVISLRTFGPCCLPPSLPSFLNCLWPHSLTTTPSLCSTTTTTTPPDPLRPVLFTFPAVGNHAGAWLADKPSCWLMGRPLRVQLWEGRWTLVKRKRWQSHPPPTHTHTQPRLHLEGRH